MDSPKLFGSARLGIAALIVIVVFLNFHIASKNAEALANTEKLLITPEGTTPTLIIPGEEVRPVVDVGGGGAPPERSEPADAE